MVKRLLLIPALAAILVFWLFPPLVALAQTVNPPTDFTLTAVGYYGVEINWTKGEGTENTMIRRKIGSYPVDRTDGVEVYYGTGEYYLDTGGEAGLDLTHAVYFYRAWGQDAAEQWSPDYAQAQIGAIGPDYSAELQELADNVGMVADNTNGLADNLATAATNLELAATLAFVIGLAALAMWQRDIILYIGGFAGILLVGLDVAQTSWAFGIPILAIAGYLLYRSVRLYF